jgi:hypothetical protein
MSCQSSQKHHCVWKQSQPGGSLVICCSSSFLYAAAECWKLFFLSTHTKGFLMVKKVYTSPWAHVPDTLIHCACYLLRLLLAQQDREEYWGGGSLGCDHSCLLFGWCLPGQGSWVCFSGTEVALVFWSDPTGLTELIIQSCVLGPVQLHPAPPPCLLSLCAHEPQGCP